MQPDELAAQANLLEEIKQFSDSRNWGELRPAIFERMKDLSLADLDGLLQELKNAAPHANVRSQVIAFLNRREISSA